jgi:hypothetical protein
VYVIKNRNKKGLLPPGQHWEEIKPQFWFEWGNEPRGFVSTGAYDKFNDYHFTGLMPIDVKNIISFHNPHS